MRCLPVLLLAATPAFVHAEDPLPGIHDLKVDRVIVFKDGHGLVVKSGSGFADAEGKVVLNDVPPAVLGTFWTTVKSGPVPIVRAERVRSVRHQKANRDAVTVPEILAANIGQRVRVTLQDDAVLSAQVVRLLAAPAPLPAEEEKVIPALPPDRPTPEPLVSRIMPPLPPFPGDTRVVLLGDDGAETVLSTAEIKRLEGRQLSWTHQETTPAITEAGRLVYDFGAGWANRPVSLNLLYLRDGLQWTPAYRLEGELKSDAVLSLQAEFRNDAEELAGASLTFVSGVPNFRFSDRRSALSLEADLRQALMPLGRSGGVMLSNAISSQMLYGGGAGDDAAPVTEAAPIGSEGVQDLYFYTTESITMPRYGRLGIPLWSQPVKLSHVYQLDLNPVRNGSGYGVQQYHSADTTDREGLISEGAVWHMLELENAGEVPWTTGPALALQDGLPVAQDILAYTAPGATGKLPLTIAPDISSAFREEETARNAAGMRWQGNDLALVTKRATVTLTNRRREASRIIVELGTGGRAFEASDAATITLNDFVAKDWEGGNAATINQHSDVRWEVTLEPGAKKELTVSLDYYVR